MVPQAAQDAVLVFEAAQRLLAAHRFGQQYLCGAFAPTPAVAHAVHLRRGATYVGQVLIEKVEKNLAVGTFDSKFPGPGAPPQKGDLAYPGSR